MARKKSSDAYLWETLRVRPDWSLASEIPMTAEFKLTTNTGSETIALPDARLRFSTLPDSVGLGRYVGKDAWLERIA